MKKIISFLLVLLLAFLPFRVNAADEEATAGYTYNISFFSWDSIYSNPRGYINACKFSGTLKSAYKAVAYRVTTEKIDIMFFDNSGNVVCASGGFMANLKSVVTFSGVVEFGYALLSSGEFDMANYASKYSTTSELSGRTYWKDNDFMSSDNPGYFNANIPMFDSEEDARSFIAGDLTEKDALNYESDLCKIRYDLEVPQNLKVEFDLVGIFRDPEYRFYWEQTDENYTKWDTEIYVYGDFYGYDGVLGIPIGDDYIYEEEFLFKDTFDSYKLRYVIAVHSYIYENGCDAAWERLLLLEPGNTVFTVESYHVYIRNSYFDGDEQHYSNWLYVTFDHDFNGVSNLSVIEVEGSVEDTPGNVGTGTGTGINGNINNDSQYDGSVDANWDESNDDIFTWISNGFGLGGDNGVITLLSDTFSFIPSELWAVFMSGIALMVLISVVKWVRG